MKVLDAASGISDGKKAVLGAAVVVATLLIYALTVYFGFRSHPFFNSPERINGWAIMMSAASLLSLAIVYWFVGHWVPPASVNAESPSFAPPTTKSRPVASSASPSNTHPVFSMAEGRASLVDI